MKSFGGVLLVAACFVACAHSFPGAVMDDSDDGYFLVQPGGESGSFQSFDSFDSDPLDSLAWTLPSWYTRVSNLFKSLMTWPTNPKSANTTSTTNIIGGHVVTVNDTTFTDGNDEYGIRIRVRVIDIKPENGSLPQTEKDSDAEVTTLPTVAATESTSSQEERTTPARSVETLEDFENDIPKNQVDTLTA